MVPITGSALGMAQAGPSDITIETRTQEEIETEEEAEVVLGIEEELVAATVAMTMATATVKVGMKAMPIAGIKACQ
ncbi:hypothetical protein GGI07_004445 [Coemansia sp. Benny D115]|nr:hypothetical protein GGI07_004445 [Coemansia sp. Benny D115]